MAIRQPKYSMEEHVRRGMELYQTVIRPQVEDGNKGKFVTIDIDTGAFEVDEDEVKAHQRLLARYPEAQTWVERIGFNYVTKLGGRSFREVS